MYQSSEEFTRWFVDDHLTRAEMTAMRKEASSNAPSAPAPGSSTTRCVDALPEWMAQPDEVSGPQELRKFCRTRSVQEYRLPKIGCTRPTHTPEEGMRYVPVKEWMSED